MKWTIKEVEFLKKHYANTKNSVLAKFLNRPIGGVVGKAFKLKLKKSAEFMIKCRTETQFKKGQVPPNKGKKQIEYMSAESILKTKKTRFKKGQKPHNALKDWQEVIRKDKYQTPYTLIKVPGQKKLQYKHLWLWIKEHGLITEKHIITFKDGNTLNCVLENLEMITMAENLRRNNYNRTDIWDKEMAKRAIQNKVKQINIKK